MSIWRRLFGGKDNLTPQRLDYLNEALALERQGDYEAALTSYRLAHRDNPNDARIMLNMAIAFTKTAQQEEAIRLYRKAAELGGADAAYNLGIVYLNGEGVTKDRNEAIRWLRTSASLGDSGAKGTLRRIGVK